MAVKPTTASSRHRAVARVLRAHPAVVAVSGPEVLPGSEFRFHVSFKLGLPLAWLADGISPNGVQATETVTLTFPEAYPLREPLIELRRDFNRSVAHVQPGSPTCPPQPCIYDGNLAELLQQQGLAGILNQLLLWLENAAIGTLIDPQHGWEPVRRDSLSDVLVADSAHLRSLAGRKSGHAAFQFTYLHSREDASDTGTYFGQLSQERVPVNARSLSLMIGEERLSRSIARGRSLGVVVWPGQLPDGKPFIADRYQPETVTDWASLEVRAADYGCVEPLRAATRWFETCLAGKKYPGVFPFVVVICARRPYPLIGSDSDIELCPYIVEASCPTLLLNGASTPVRTAARWDTVNVPLLRRMSGDDETPAPPWTLFGCGSLGSKIGLHLARAGRGPAIAVDRKFFSPHNAARNALSPQPGDPVSAWLGKKAVAFAEACEGLAQATKPMDRDVIDITRDQALARQAFPKHTWVVVNATASLAVREALAAMPRTTPRPRTMEAALMAEGQVGLLTVEGPDLNPATGDLIAEAYDRLRLLPEHRRMAVFTGGATLRRQAIGDGCGSATMAMSDARVSMLAAPMAETIGTMQKRGLPESGKVLVGQVGDDGLSVTWETHDVASATIIEIEAEPDRDSFQVRISARADAQIAADVARHPAVETGGILLGRLSEASRTFHVIGLLPAPDDSVRDASEFVLGKRGLRDQLRVYSESCDHSLYCLGTWHSHLSASGPSRLDEATAGAIALARLAPSVLLIHTPQGYKALLAEAKEDES